MEDGGYTCDLPAACLSSIHEKDETIMLNHVEYPSSVKEGTETPGAFDQNGQRFYVLDRLQEQASRIRYLLDTTVFFRDQLEACQAAGNAEAAQSPTITAPNICAPRKPAPAP